MDMSPWPSAADSPNSMEPPGVRLLTIHASKRLEFKCVSLIGLNDGSLPDFRSLGSENEVASERRLAYVATTRASRVLRVSRPTKRNTRDGQRPQEPSRFIAEMGLILTPDLGAA